jgi:hypothetical protein
VSLPERIIAGAAVYSADGDGTLVTMPFRKQSILGETTLLGAVNFRFNIALPPAACLGDASVPIGLSMAMAAGLPLEIIAPVSPSLLRQLPRYQEIHTTFFPDETVIPIHAEKRAEEPTQVPSGRGAFLSNGIDSLHCILDHRDEITHYVFIVGFEIWLKHSTYAARSVELAKTTAAKLGKPLIVVETNMFDFAHHYIPWPRDGHPLQASVGFLLSPLLQDIVIALDYPWRRLYRGPEHPVLYDQLRSDSFRLRGGSGRHGRQDKLRVLAQLPEWLPFLRVCWDLPADRLNCGSCEKCLRTMVGLTVENALHLCPSLPPLDLNILRQHRYSEKRIAFYEEMLEAAEHRPLPTEFVNALRHCVQCNQMDATVEKLRPYLAKLAGSKAYQTREKKLRDLFFDSIWKLDSTWVLKKLRRHSATYREDLKKILRKFHKPLFKRSLWKLRIEKWRQRWRKDRGSS